MAVFGAPLDDAERCGHAVGTSLEILQRLDRLNAAGKIPPTRVGIRLHIGEAVTGKVGSAERKEYTIIYDNAVIARPGLISFLQGAVTGTDASFRFE